MRRWVACSLSIVILSGVAIADPRIPLGAVSDATDVRQPEVRQHVVDRTRTTAIDPLQGGEFHFFTTPGLETPGLVGSYVNQNLRHVAAQTDWRITQAISGTRVDPEIDFTDDWGLRASVGLTSGTDDNWELFSVQWDGFIQIVTPGTILTTISDDSNRLWIDIDSLFGSAAPELVDNHWGSGQAPTQGELSVPLSAGIYRIRIQYEEGGGGNWMRLFSASHPRVRVAYVVPSNRSPRPTATAQLQEWVDVMHGWFADQMERYGLGKVTFNYETELDGTTPRIHTVHVSETDDYLRGDIWGRTIDAAAAAGTPVWNTGEVWLLIPEIQVQQPDGAIIGNAALGAGYGHNAAPGIATFGAYLLSMDLEAALQDNREYDGLLEPAIGPYPLAQDLSFPWFEGTTISSVTSSALGALAHEMAHGFGLPHNGRNDDNFHGNLMGNGLRGIRGALYPDLYGNDDTVLGYGEALALRTNQFFTGVVDPTNPSPSLTVLTSGAVPLVQGRVVVEFQADDPNGLSAALLIRDGELVGEIDLEGAASGTFAISTAHYIQGQANTFAVAVYDMRGGRAQVTTSITPGGGTRAPIPHCRITRMQPLEGESVLLQASSSTDPDTPVGLLTAEWDLDDDGVFEIGPSALLTHMTAFPSAGARLVTVRLTDPEGNQSVSMPVPVCVRSGSTGVNDEWSMAGAPLVVSSFPSPFRASTTIHFALAVAGPVEVEIFDVAGRLVRRLKAHSFERGSQGIVWDGTDATGRVAPSGVYFYRLNVGNWKAIGRVVRLE